MSEKKRRLYYFAKSGFVRSVFLRVLSIFIVVSIAIAAVAFFSFTSEIRKNILSDRKRQLLSVEETISKRMEEITSIAYNISTDSAFYLEPVARSASSSDMSDTLARYLVGNSFIEHLAYYRLSEPDKIYISSGERSLSEFFMTSFGLDRAEAEANIRGIQSAVSTEVRAITYGNEGNGFFAYLYPLPQLSAKPQAYVLMLIPFDEATPLFDTLVANSGGAVVVFDARGKTIYKTDELDSGVSLENYLTSGDEEEIYTSDTGEKYVLQKVVSEDNGWSYVSVLRQSDTLPGVAGEQLLVIGLLFLLMVVAIIAMFFSTVAQYKPISNLAEAVVEKADGGEGGATDERVLLSNAIAALTDDSEQKERFERAYHEAEAASKAKSAFLSNMSHDIRTPMNAVIGMTAIALKHADEPDYVRECLKKVQVSSQYLLDIINNVLDMSKIESGGFLLTEEAVDLPKLIDGLVTLMEPSMEARSQLLKTELGELSQSVVIGDNVRLMQIFVNILSNSVKFTPDGGTISLGMHQTECDDAGYGNYVFTFSDTGMGMSPEFVSRVFDTFARAEDTDVSKVEGTGLGMAIAKNLVTLMGGTITCESELKRGTTFTVTLHMKLAEAGSEANAPNGYTGTHTAQADMEDEMVRLDGKRILIVEDNFINREIANKIISETGATAEEAVNGREAVELFKQRPEGYFDIILMDIQMPVMNGYDATSEIRASGRRDALSIPIYAMTANTFDEDVRQVRDAGMNGHIGKPYTPEMLYRVLAQALGE